MLAWLKLQYSGTNTECFAKSSIKFDIIIISCSTNYASKTNVLKFNYP